MSIAGRAVRGAAWNMVAGVGSRVISLIGTLILTRFIAPAEYGEISAAQVTVWTVHIFTSYQLGQFIIARRAPADVCFQAAVYHIVIGIAAQVLVIFVGPAFGPLLDAPHTGRYIPGFAVSVMIDRFGYIPDRVLVRDLRFRTVALTRGCAELAFVATALSLAPHIAGMAIIVGNLVRSGIVTTVFLIAAPRREWLVPTRLRWRTTRDIFGFGVPLAAGTLAEFAASRWDNLLVSRFFGPPVLGVYNLAYNLADTPTTNVAEHIGDVLLPSFAKMKPGQRTQALLRSAAIMALLVFPLSVGMAAVAPTVVRTLFDPRWFEVAPMLMILSSLSVVRPMSWCLASFLQVQQRPRTLMILGFLKLATLLALVCTLGRLGPRWTCVCVGLAFTVHSAAMLYVTQIAEGVPAMGFISGALPPLLACAPMFAAVVATRKALEAAGIGAGWLSLVLQVAAGMVTYAGAALVVARTTALDMLNLVKKAVKNR